MFQLLVLLFIINVAIFTIISADYRCIINEISKNEAIYVMQNADLTEKCKKI